MSAAGPRLCLRTLALIAASLLLASCATIPREGAEREARVWEAARECERRAPGVRTTRVDHFGRVWFESPSAGETARFNECFRAAVKDLMISPGRLVVPEDGPRRSVVALDAEGGALRLSVRLNDKERATMVLDTGATVTVVSPTVMKQLGVSVPWTAPLLMVQIVGGSTVSMPFVRLQTLAVGDVTVADIDVGVFDALPGRADGLLGADFLGHFKVTLDRASRQLVLESAQGAPRAASVPASPIATPPPAWSPTPASALAWRTGDEWSFRWESPRGKGAFVWSIVGEREIDGATGVIMKSGSREVLYRRQGDMLGWHVQRVSGLVTERASPGDFYLRWPLRPGQRWEYTYRYEHVRDRVTAERTLHCEVEAAERVTVPAGEFDTLRVGCRYAGGPVAFTYWFAEAVKMFVKQHAVFEYGVRVRELTGYRID